MLVLTGSAGCDASEERYVSVYKQLFMEIRVRDREYIPVYTEGSRRENSAACATVFPSDTNISMRLLNSAFLFTAEIWAIINALE